eukprot:TRINITY_DN710_c0_g1_i1.p1 TRINITY_DN710_c0_g1~~TRINITY_DN710_c0_g1_i1.p1  ORF type:complete len:235 (+),score=39.41 TRINITY_DN710_c0_g1_i1:98-802(+)
MSARAGYSLVNANDTENITDVDAIKKEIRVLERDIDAKMDQFSVLCNTLLRSDHSIEDYTIMEAKSAVKNLEDLLQRLVNLNESLSQAPATSVSIVQQHRERMRNYSSEFSRTRNTIMDIIKKAELFGGSSDRNDSGGVNINMTNLMKEHTSISSSSSSADELILQAQQARQTLGMQSRTLRGTGNKLDGLGGKFGDINTVIGKISYWKTRNNMIIATFIGFCVCFLIWYWLTS